MALLSDFIRSLSGKKQPQAKTSKAVPNGYAYYNPSNQSIVTNTPKGPQTIYQQAGAQTQPGYDPYSGYTYDGGGYTLGSSTGGSYSGGGSSSGGYSGAYDPAAEQAAQEAAQKQSLIGDLQAKWSTLQNVFNGLFGQVDNYAKDATKRIFDAADTQQAADINNFNKTTGLTSSMYAARGLGDSSYLGDAQGQNSELFNQGLAQNALNRESQLGQIGQTASAQKAQLTAQRDAYSPYMSNLGQYGVSDLMGLQGNLQGAIGNANTTAAGLGTNSDFIGKLNAITPLESQASAQLAAKLKNLTLSSAPAQAKKYVAQGLIKASTLNDTNAQGYWSNYFEQLLNGQAV